MDLLRQFLSLLKAVISNEKIKKTDKFYLKCRTVLSDLSVFFVFIAGIGLGFIVSAGADPNDAIEAAAPLIGAALYFILLLFFCIWLLLLNEFFCI